jgi:hypothetical protein
MICNLLLKNNYMIIKQLNSMLENITKVYENKVNLMSQPDLLIGMENEIKLISEFLNLERDVAVLLAVMICEQLMNEITPMRKLMRNMGYNSIDIINSQHWTKMLKKRGWISISKRKFHSFKMDEFEVSKDLLDAIIYNDKSKLTAKPPESFSEALLQLRKSISNAIGDYEVDEFIQNVMVELESYSNYAFIFEIINTKELIDIEKIMLVWMASDLVYGREEFDFNIIIENFTQDPSYSFWFKNRISKGISHLIKDNYIEFKRPNFIDFSEVKFGEKTNDLIAELRQNSNQKKLNARYCRLIEPKDLTVQELYFNNSIKASIDKVDQLLNESYFKNLMCKFSENGMTQCLTMLFHGLPGTGKTELVKQLALKHERSIYQVDISGIKDMWVGESEKNMKKVFVEYASAIKYNRRMPILLFNEADAILGIRTHVQHSVDQMYNSLQNILLQELEDMKGIFIATTNLINNIDSAFDRRLLFKQKFELPDEDTRFSILKSQFASFDDWDLRKIAQKNELSGGQIQNIKKKIMADEILFGNDGYLANKLLDYINSEVNFRTSINKIGF